MIKYIQHSNIDWFDSQDGCSGVGSLLSMDTWHKGVIYLPGRMDDMGVNHQCLTVRSEIASDHSEEHFKTWAIFTLEVFHLVSLKCGWLEQLKWQIGETSISVPRSAARPGWGFLHYLFPCGLLPFPSPSSPAEDLPGMWQTGLIHLHVFCFSEGIPWGIVHCVTWSLYRQEWLSCQWS